RDGNGRIEPADVAFFVREWFESITGGTLAADFDGNGVVNPADIAAFLAEWSATGTGGGRLGESPLRWSRRAPPGSPAAGRAPAGGALARSGSGLGEIESSGVAVPSGFIVRMMKSYTSRW